MLLVSIEISESPAGQVLYDETNFFMPGFTKLSCALLAVLPLAAETGRDAWLRYASLDDNAARPYRASVPATIATFGDTLPVRTARQELIRGIHGMLGRIPRTAAKLPSENSIVLGTLEDLRSSVPQLALTGELSPDAFWLRTFRVNGESHTVIAGANPAGVLYGAFAYLRKIAVGEPVDVLDENSHPTRPYAGSTNGTISMAPSSAAMAAARSSGTTATFARIWAASREYGRLLASLGINGCSINNVNADPQRAQRRTSSRRSRASPTASARGACGS